MTPAAVSVATKSVPDAAHAPRAKRRWTVAGGSFDSSLVDSARRDLPVRRQGTRALCGKYGDRDPDWTAKPAPSADARPKTKTPRPMDPRILDRLPPAERRQFIRRPQIGAENAVLRLARDVFSSNVASVLAAYDLEKGEQLWARPEACRLQEARGDFARLACFQPRSDVVIAARSRSDPHDEDVLHRGPAAGSERTAAVLRQRRHAVEQRFGPRRLFLVDDSVVNRETRRGCRAALRHHRCGRRLRRRRRERARRAHG